MTGETSPAAVRPRFAALDGLRGVAALSVLLFHVAWPNHLSHSALVRHSYLAVDLFFILSGFVIYANYAERLGDAASVGRFLVLRLFRLYPLHLAMLAALVALEAARLAAQQGLGAHLGQPAFSGRFLPQDLVPNLLLVQGLHTLDHLGWNTPSWSISCEFAAYAAFAAVMASGIGRSRWFFTAAAAGAAAAYVWLALYRGSLDATYDWGIVRCLAGFALGMVACHIGPALACNRYGTLFERAGPTMLVLLLGVMSAASGPAIGLAIPLLLGLVAVLQFDRGPLARLLMTRAVQFLGRVSYSIYMSQLLVLLVVSFAATRLFGVPTAPDPMSGEPVLVVDPWAGDLLLLAVAALLLAVAALGYRLIEAPARSFGRRLVDGRAFRRGGPAAAPRRARPRWRRRPV